MSTKDIVNECAELVLSIDDLPIKEVHTDTDSGTILIVWNEDPRNVDFKELRDRIRTVSSQFEAVTPVDLIKYFPEYAELRKEMTWYSAYTLS